MNLSHRVWRGRWRRTGAGVPISGWLSLCQGVVHAPGLDWEPRELLRGCRLSAWHFDNLVVGQRPFERYQVATAPAAIIDLSDGFDAMTPVFASTLPG